MEPEKSNIVKTETNTNDDSKVIFCIDLSGSMGCTHPIGHN